MRHALPHVPIMGFCTCLVDIRFWVSTADDAGEMITELALAAQLGLAIEDLTSVFRPFLTCLRGVKLAAQTFRQGCGDAVVLRGVGLRPKAVR